MGNRFQSFLSAPRRSIYRPVEEYSSAITRKQALADLDELQYLMDNRYCGREYWERKGIEFRKCYGEIKGFIETSETIYISDFCRKIHAAFDVGIVDNHLSFASPMTGLLRFSGQYSAYFTDLLIEKQGEAYVVIGSKTEAVAPSECVTDPECLYPTLAPKGRERYLAGCRSYIPLQEMEISIQGTIRKVPLHRCRAITKTEHTDICMAGKMVDGIQVIRSNCCDYVGGLTEETDYAAMGQKYRKTDVLILNYLSNEGGYNRITREFIMGLNGYVHCQEYSMKLISPVTEKRDCAREWVRLSEAVPYEREKGSYQGTVYMLVNSDTASSGETAVLYGKSLRNFVLIGENTMGCNTFGNVAAYQLAYSRIVCRIPNVVNLCENPSDCEEGRGFTPDYWVDSPDVEAEAVAWIAGYRGGHR